MRVSSVLVSLSSRRIAPDRLISKFIGLLLAAALMSAQPARADETDWSVAEVEGGATFEVAGAAPKPLALGERLPLRARIVTAAGGRATLTRNGDVVEVGPASALELPADAGGRPVKGVIQTVGSLLFKIVTRPEDPFRVDTPYLAALVKGTVFHVLVTGNGSTLRVDRGAVEVMALRTRETSLVRAGQTAFAAARSGPGLRVTGTPSDQSSQNQSRGQPAAPASDGLSADLDSIVSAAATHPDPAIARAQVEALIGDHPEVALEIAMAAARARPEIAAAVARAAARARPDRAAEIIAVIGALAPGQGVGGADLFQASPGRANSGPVRAFERPTWSAGAKAGGVAVQKPADPPNPVATVPPPSLSGP
jgi:hypothetical protein